MNENLGRILEWLYPGKANVGYLVERQDDGTHVIRGWRQEIMSRSQPTEAEMMSREADWQTWRDSDEGTAQFNSGRLSRLVPTALVEVVASQQAGETPPAWAVDVITEAQSVLRNG